MFRFLCRSSALRGKRRAGRRLKLPLLEQLEARCVPAFIRPAFPTYVAFHPHLGQPLGSSGSPAGLDPAQIRHAYGIDAISFTNNGTTVAGDGTGETVAIVDAYDDPSIAGDLSTFDQQYGLAAPPSFTKVGIDANGNASTSSFPVVDAQWAAEIELDVEWVHAVAPGAGIILVEAYSNNFPDLMNAVNYARSAPGVVAVSMSWGGYEFYGETQYDSSFTTPSGHGGVTFFASSGDEGFAILWPAASARVVGVGGTTLNVDAAGNYLSETAWSGSNGGLSGVITRPSYQNNQVIHNGASVISANGMRAGPDVAYDANPLTGVAVYGTFGWNGWAQVGGTSAGAPQWAALMAIADQGRGIAGNSPMDGFTQTLPALYQLNSADYHDVTAGTNLSYAAGPGFDLVTGSGTPVANRIVSDLTGVPQVLTSIVVSPANAKVGDGGQQQFTAVADNQFGQAMYPQPVFSWSVPGGSGTIDSNGLYSAPSSGTGTDTVLATATVTGVTASGSVTVSFLPGPTISSLTANPSPVTGTATSLAATVNDPNLGSLTYTWSVVSAPAGAKTPALSPATGSVSNGTGTVSLGSTATFYQAGTYQFQFAVSDVKGVSANSSVTVNVTQTLTSVVVSPASAGVVDGGQQQFSAVADDQFGKALATQPSFTWSMVSGAGTISASGLYTAPASGTGTDVVQAAATLGTNSASGTATASYAPGLTIISVTANPNPVTGTTTTLTVTAVDPFGTPYYMWMALPPGPTFVMFSNNGTATASTTKVTFMMAGTYTFQVTVSDPSGHMISAKLNVTVLQTMSRLQVQPGTATVADGRQQQFMALAFNQFNMPMTPPPALSWSVISGPGTVSSSGLYTAPASGSGTAIVQASATANGVTLTGTATVTLIAGPTVSSIGANPNPVTGTTTTLSVTASNPSGGTLFYSWTAVAMPPGVPLPGFSVNYATTAATTMVTFHGAGNYTFQVAVMSPGGLSATAQVSVTVLQTLTSLMASPNMTVYRGGQVQLMAMPLDQFHFLMTAQPAFTWTVINGPGTLSSTGLYTAPTTSGGTAIIKVSATLNGATVSTTITLTVF
jgi:subtilase family serine protease